MGAEIVLKKKAIEDEARYDGKWVLRTNTNLSTPEVVLAYKSLWQIEHAFRELKSGLKIRPIYVRTENHVRESYHRLLSALVPEAAL